MLGLTHISGLGAGESQDSTSHVFHSLQHGMYTEGGSTLSSSGCGIAVANLCKHFNISNKAKGIAKGGDKGGKGWMFLSHNSPHHSTRNRSVCVVAARCLLQIFFQAKRAIFSDSARYGPEGFLYVRDED